MSDEMCPEQHLILAVIQQAITDIVERPTCQPIPRSWPPAKQRKRRAAQKARLELWARQRDDAKDWLFGPSNVKTLMSFEWCCHAVGMRPGLARRRVEHMMSGAVQCTA